MVAGRRGRGGGGRTAKWRQHWIGQTAVLQCSTAVAAKSTKVGAEHCSGIKVFQIKVATFTAVVTSATEAPSKVKGGWEAKWREEGKRRLSATAVAAAVGIVCATECH